MQKELTIISFHETYPGDEGSHSVNHFPERRLALDFIKKNIREDLEETGEFVDEEDYKYLVETIRKELINGKSGKTSYTAGDHEYSLVWDFVPGESNVSDDELITTLEQYCNANRSKGEFNKVCVKATETMHRYCQNELYKLIACMLRAMASCRYDERNIMMHNRSEMIVKFMDEYGL